MLNDSLNKSIRQDLGIQYGFQQDPNPKGKKKKKKKEKKHSDDLMPKEQEPDMEFDQRFINARQKELKKALLQEFSKRNMRKEDYITEKTPLIKPLLDYHNSGLSPYRTDNLLL